MVNNWTYDKDKSIWKNQSEKLQKSDFELIKQDFKSYRFYQKCLSGSTYVISNRPVNQTNLVGDTQNIDNIYDILGSGYNSKSFYYTNSLTYSKPFLTVPPTNASTINNLEKLNDFVDKVLPDYNFTLKNLFTPERTIKTEFENLYYVDLISIDRIDDLTEQFQNLVIDGIPVKNNHRILLKDQWLEVTIQTSQNPSDFFYGYYELVDSSGSLSTYRIPSSDNGIYTFNNGILTKTEELNKYEDLIRYTICSKLGSSNKEKKFRLQRLKSGFYPEWYKGKTYPFGPDGESMFFEEASTFLIRQRVDYNNIYELVLNRTIKHGTQSLSYQIEDSEQLYTIPNRAISVGEFGVILVHQENITNIIWNKVKKNLRDISESNKYYWVCGDVGTVLKISKNFLEIEELELTSDNSLRAIRFNSISFWNDLIGVVVGEFNNIWYTFDGGINWKSIKIDDFIDYNFNKVLFKNIDLFYVGGDNGVFIEFTYNLGSWNPIKKRISKYLYYIEDEFPLVEDITDIEIFRKNDNDFVALTTLSNNLIIYDLNKSINGTWSFIYLDYQKDLGDLKSISYWNSEEKLYITNDLGIYQLDPLDGLFGLSNSNVFSVTISNFLTQSGINDTFTYLNDLIYTGNFSLWEKTNPSSLTSSVYDSDFFTRTKPRMLYLNYDIASKLYWFDDFGQYRLPNKIEIDLDLLQGSLITESEFSFIPVFDSINDKPEMNWIEYWKDSIKTFKYYSDLNETNIVKPSFTFSYSEYINKEFIYSNQEVTTIYEDILPLMPNAIPPNQKAGITQSSRFRNIPGLNITLPEDDNNLYFYDYLGVWKESVPSGVGPEIGDLLEIKSSAFEGNFIINRVEKKEEVLTPGKRALLYFNVDPFPASEWIQLTYNGSPITGQISGSLNQFTLNLNIFNAINASFSQTGFLAAIPGVILLRSPLSPNPTDYNGETIDFISSTTSISFISTEFEGGEDPINTDIYFSYFYTDFNENILNNLTQDDVFTVRNLNKFGKESQFLLDNLEKHFINNIYNFEETNNILTLQPKYSRLTAYYNIQSLLNLINDSQNLSYESKYSNGFLNFGYTPQYNILSYLSYLDPEKFIPTKEVYSMPVWENITCSQSSTQSYAYIDAGLETNKIYIGQDIKYIYDSLLPWTFINVYINNNTTYDNLLIIDKYPDSESGMWVIELHDRITFEVGQVVIDTVTIESRRTLKQISDDLIYLNNIHRPKDKTKSSYDLTSSSITGGWDNYESDIRTKYPTDSYAKYLLSDYDIIQSLYSLIYTDYNNQLSLQTIKTDEIREIKVSSVSINNNLYQLNFSQKHNIKNGDYIIVKSTVKNTLYPNRILGYHHVTVLEGQEFSLILPIIQSGAFNPPNLTIIHVDKDEFFNYQPIDIFNIGVEDKKITQSVEILSKNYSISGKKYNLTNLDLTKYKFRLIDGLDLIQLNKKYPWILEAEITNATIGIQNDTLTWYKGIWECGRWFEGNWISGLWISGDWYSGNWTSKKITDSKLSVKIDKENTNTDSSIWFNGRWFGGSWENGTWIDGRWYGGTWSNGKWLDGIWNDGTWLNGIFSSGIWVLGDWKFGKFNCDNGPAFWLDGIFTGGDFENGTWYNGTFDEKELRNSRFGTRAYNSRNATWLSGKFLSGSFHSGLNIDDNGNTDVSEVHKYSKWGTGLFTGGNFYGGVAYNINFKNALWYGGILEDIKINSIQELNNGITFSVIRLEGEYLFNINDEFLIMDNQIEDQFSGFGSTKEPTRYKVTFSEYDVENNETVIYPNINIYQFNPVSGSASNLRLVSYFENSNWKSGVWYNGLFKNGTFDGGVWYNGKFIGNWG